MFDNILLGCGFAFAAGIQPGPLQAFLLTRVTERGWRSTLPAALAPVISDGPVALLVLLVLRQFPAGWDRILQMAGGILLLVLATGAFRRWRRPAVEAPATGAAPRTLLQAVCINLVNPGPYLGWSLVLGPAFLAAWPDRPASAIALVISFYVIMVLVLGGTIFLFGASRLLGPRGRRLLLLFSTLALAALGVWQLTAGLLAVVPVQAAPKPVNNQGGRPSFTESFCCKDTRNFFTVRFFP